MFCIALRCTALHASQGTPRPALPLLYGICPQAVFRVKVETEHSGHMSQIQVAVLGF